ncbi:MAG: CBS domain-containing protein [Deltaproteobacteria bacterium]|nr:CBS domain-containing protein [Deltaproteobacteria bacterium]
MLTNKVSEIMTTAVITAEPSSTIREVTQLMVDRRVGRVVITEKDAPAGIFTETDVLRRVMNRVLDVHKTPIRRVMTTPVQGVPQGTSIVEVLGRMYQGRYRHLLVFGDDRRMVGLVSMRRILNLVVELGTNLRDSRTVGEVVSGAVPTVAAAVPVTQVIDKMVREQIGCVMVSGGGKTAGIFTERDVLTRIALEDRDMGQVPVSEVMTADPLVATGSTPVQDVLATMRENGFRHMPVAGDGEELAGIVSVADVLQYAKALDIDDVVRKAWKEIEEFWESDENYTPG